jgi:hypothetical protein
MHFPRTELQCWPELQYILLPQYEAPAGMHPPSMRVWPAGHRPAAAATAAGHDKMVNPTATVA